MLRSKISTAGRLLRRGLLASVAAIVIALLNGSAPAAVITWSAPAGISADTNVVNTYPVVGAFNLGATGVPSTAVNGVTFSPFEVTGLSNTVGNFNITVTATPNSANTAFGSGSAPFSSLSAAYQTLLESGGSVFGSDMTLTMSALTVGQEYVFEWWSNDSGPRFFPYTTTATAGNSVGLNDNTSGFVAGGVGQFATGTFTADSTVQTILFSGIIQAPVLNAFQLQAVPEPAAAIFFGLIGIVGLMRRNRRAIVTLKMVCVGVAGVLLVGLSQPALADPISYTANLNTAAGNPVTDIMILETDGLQTYLDYSFTLPGSGLSVLTHDVPFTPTKSLVIGLTEGVDDTEIVMLLNPDFALANLGNKFSVAFPNTRHSELITRLTSAVAGDTTELGWFRNTFFPGDGAAASFNTGGPFRVAEFTVLGVIGASATSGNWIVTNVQNIPEGGLGSESGRATTIIDETATDNGPFDVQMSLSFPSGGEVAVAKNVLNDTSLPITLFQLQLGQGLGDQFVPSTIGDGLSFIELLPNREDTGAFPGLVYSEDTLTFTGLLNPDEIAEFVTFVSSNTQTFTMRQIAIPEPTGIAATVIGFALLGLRRRRAQES